MRIGSARRLTQPDSWHDTFRRHHNADLCWGGDLPSRRIHGVLHRALLQAEGVHPDAVRRTATVRGDSDHSDLPHVLI